MAEVNLNPGTQQLRRGGKRIMIAVAVIVLPLLILWGGFALWYQIPGGPVSKAITVVVWAVIGLSVNILAVKGRPKESLGCFLVVFAGLLAWWNRIPPSNNRVWAEDVSRSLSGCVVFNI